jgi:DNA invertase Pin-like site-specific DNA recombinase
MKRWYIRSGQPFPLFSAKGFNYRDLAIVHERNKGTNNHSAKLDDDKVRQIREKLASGTKRIELAKEYGVSTTTISDIARKKIWRDVR